MKQAYLISTGFEEFVAAREQFAHLVKELQSEQTLHLEHGDVEQIISEQGTELLRRLLQGHLDLRAVRECRRDTVAGSDGVVRSQYRENCERKLMTLFGEVTVRRMRYGAPGTDSVFPLDAELNLPGDKYSHGLREGTRRAAERGAHKIKTRLSAGEKRNRKRMATVATVYSVAPHVRSPESVMGADEQARWPKPRARNKRVWASVERDPGVVTEELFEEAARCR